MLPDKLSKHGLEAQVITREKAILHVQFYQIWVLRWNSAANQSHVQSQSLMSPLQLASVVLAMQKVTISDRCARHDLKAHAMNTPTTSIKIGDWQWRKTMKWGSLQHPVNNYKSYEVIPSHGGNKIWSNKSKQTTTEEHEQSSRSKWMCATLCHRPL